MSADPEQVRQTLATAETAAAHLESRLALAQRADPRNRAVILEDLRGFAGREIAPGVELIATIPGGARVAERMRRCLVVLRELLPDLPVAVPSAASRSDWRVRLGVGLERGEMALELVRLGIDGAREQANVVLAELFTPFMRRLVVELRKVDAALADRIDAVTVEARRLGFGPPQGPRPPL